MLAWCNTYFQVELTASSYLSLGLILVTDAIPAMGLPPGRHTLGQLVVEVEGANTYIAGKGTPRLISQLATQNRWADFFLSSSPRPKRSLQICEMDYSSHHPLSYCLYI